MTEEDKDNETIKLTASLINAIAGAVISVGTLTPLANLVYEVLPKTVEPALVYGSAVVCIGVGLVIHLVGHAVLKGALQ